MTDPSTSAVTQGVRIDVVTRYVAEQSEPNSNRWLFAYRITISNEGDQPVQLASRHWVITNSNGVVQEVKGAGVVGQQPRMRPGEGFQYVSACPLDTAVGTMHGTYQMLTDKGDEFEAEIPMFVLADPQALN